jgi:hypothetical protein
MMRTLSQDLSKEKGSLYVWGTNINSEIGLSDETVMKNISYYVKCSMRKIVKNESFEDNTVIQIAAGNCTSLALIADKESNRQTIVQAGLTAVTKDEREKRTVFSQKETDDLIDTIPALPFGIAFT